MATLYKILPLLIVILVAVLIIKVFIPLWFRFKLKRITRPRPIIAIADKNGFIIYSINSADTKSREIKWNEINKIDLAGTQTLHIAFHNNTLLSLEEKEYTGWLSLLKAIPANVQVNEALSAYKDTRFSNLSCCKVCGKIAVKNNECLNCIADTYEKYCKDAESFGQEIKTERAFIKENQLDWFTSFIDGTKVDFYAKEILYDDCDGWSPLVTAFEVIQYDKEQNADDPS
ncbi:hypothetical protein [Ferruginibacter profundus]